MSADARLMTIEQYGRWATKKRLALARRAALEDWPDGKTHTYMLFYRRLQYQHKISRKKLLAKGYITQI